MVVALTRNPDLGIAVLVLEGIVLFALRQSGVRRRLAEANRERDRQLETDLADDALAEIVDFPEHVRRSDVI